MLLLLGGGSAEARWDPAVWARVRTLLARADKTPGRKVAVFDFDNTLIFNDLGYAAWIHLVAGRGLVKDRALLETLLPRPLVDDFLTGRGAAADPLRFLSQINAYYQKRCAADGERSCYAWLTKLFAGHSPAELRAFARRVVARELARPPCWIGLGDTGRQYLGVRPYMEQRELVELLGKHGIETWVVTASAEVVVAELAPRLGIRADHVVGVRLELDQRGRLRPELRGPMTYREGKVQAIRQRIGAQPLLVVGDSVTDQEMLEQARGLAILIERGDRRLRVHAEKRGWAVQPVFRSVEGLPACQRSPSFP